jgi:hypothetical protein
MTCSITQTLRAEIGVGNVSIHGMPDHPDPEPATSLGISCMRAASPSAPRRAPLPRRAAPPPRRARRDREAIVVEHAMTEETT